VPSLNSGIITRSGQEEGPSNLTLPQISMILPQLKRVRTYIYWYDSRNKGGDWYQVQRDSQTVDEYGFFTGKFAVDKRGIKEALHAKHLDVYVGTENPRKVMIMSKICDY